MRLNEKKNLLNIFIGVDVGSSFTKLVAINEYKELVGWVVKKSGTNFSDSATSCLNRIMDINNFKKDNIVRSISTGYGRKNVSYANSSRTEIGCHAKGCFYYFPFSIDIVDIGGQDNKIIKVNNQGKRTSFKMNRKCAAGTGSFLEEMSLRLNIDINDMNKMASSAMSIVHLGSFCTVFSSTEVLENIRRGKNVSDIVKGIFFSILKRISEMDSFSNKVVMTGGVVAHNSYLIDMATEFISQPILVPRFPHITGALGAALYAMEL